MSAEPRCILVGIDDTDNLTSRGTGHRARQLGERLRTVGLATCAGITRHQLLVDPAIPYTSHNSSACLRLRLKGTDIAAVIELCRDFLRRESAPGSDAGLCVAPFEQITAQIQAFGRSAKEQVLTQATAREQAATAGLTLEGLTGDQGGVIGALAATALHAAGNDGRYLWLPGLREAAGDELSAAAIKTHFGVGEVRPLGSQIPVSDDALVALGDWPRPVLLEGIPVLLVEENDNAEQSAFRVAARDYIKQHY